jgi:ABC-2 type transport system permease protein
MLHILAKEFTGFLDSLIAYVVIGAFLTGIGLIMWVFPETSVLDFGYADMDALFRMGPYVLIFLIPAITMRSFSEEKKSGTIELLFTKPLSDWDIILGKFLASFLLVLFAILPTIIYFYTVYQLGAPKGNVDSPGVIGSYIGFILLGAAFCAIGILASSLTRNQVVAFILAAFLCFIFFTGFESLAMIDPVSGWASAIRQLGIFFHYESMSKALIDTRDVIYFISLIFLMLLATRIILGSRSW